MLAPVASLLEGLGAEHRQVVLFGEVFGRGVQSFTYGESGLGFRAFDLLVDGAYADHDRFLALCRLYDVATVPALGRPAFSLEAVRALASGRAFAGDHIREGVVVKPLAERTDPALGRVILKYVSDDYLLGAYEDTTDR